MSGARLGVLIVDDSPSARVLLRELVAAEPDMRVLGEASDGAEAVSMTCALQPDVVVMDIEMPRIDGIAATREIMRLCPTPVVLVSASLNDAHVSRAVEGFSAGALTALPKPVGFGSEGAQDAHRRFVRSLRAMAAVKVVRRYGPSSLPPSPPDPAHCPVVMGLDERRRQRPRLVAMAASTGGPAALEKILSALPATLGVAVLVVQHITEGFVGGMARWLDGACQVRVKVAEHGERLVAGTVYLAPDGHHLGVRVGGWIHLTDGPSVGGFRPSATVLFESVATAYGPGALGVILTGIGEDGVDGLRAIHARGGVVLAQSEASSVVYGMPRAAVTAGVTHRVVGLDAIAAEVLGLLRGPSPSLGGWVDGE